MRKNAMVSWGFRYTPAVVRRDSERFLVWEQNGKLYQWTKGAKVIENVDTDEIIPVIHIRVRYPEN